MRPTRSPRRLVLATLAAPLLVAPLLTSTVLAPPAAAAGLTPVASPRAVALGDSFASGEGLAPYEPGTDTATDECHRSDRAYPTLLESSGSRRFETLRSVACSGATVGTVLAGSAAEPSQLAVLGPQTRTVTLTVGGNDVGFAKVLGDCIYSPLAPTLVPGSPGCASRDDVAVRAATTYLRKVSLPVLLQLIQARAPRARIYVTGYPRLFGLAFSNPAGCRVGSLDPAGQVPLFVSGDDVRWIRSNSDALNAAIAAAVRGARRHHVRAAYVDVAEEFTGHNVCSSGKPWVNGLLLAPGNPPTVVTASFHPNARGQREYAKAVAVAARPLT